METKNRVQRTLPFEIYEHAARHLPLPVSAFSFFDDEHRDVVLVYEEDIEKVAFIQ